MGRVATKSPGDKNTSALWNSLITDYLSQTDTSDQNMASNLIFPAGKGPNAIKSKLIDETGIADGKFLTYVSSSGKVEYAFVTDSGIAADADIDSSKILIYGATQLAEWRHASDLTKMDAADIYQHPFSNSDIASDADIDPSKILMGTLTHLSDWRHASDTRKIDGADLYAASVTYDKNLSKFEKSADYILRKTGSNYEAVHGTNGEIKSTNVDAKIVIEYAIANGETIFLRPATYAAADIALKSNIEIYGQRGTILQLDTADKAFFKATGTVTNIRISNLTFDCKSGTYNGTGAIDLNSTTIQNVMIDHNYIHHCAAGSTGIWAGILVRGRTSGYDGCRDIIITNNILETSARDGIACFDTLRTVIADNTLLDCQDAIVAGHCKGVTISGNSIEFVNETNGWGIDTGGARDVAIIGNTVIKAIGSTGAGIFIRSYIDGGDVDWASRNVTCIGNILNDCYVGIYIGVGKKNGSVASPIKDVTCKGNVVYDFTNYGIEIRNSVEGLVLEGNIVKDGDVASASSGAIDIRVPENSESMLDAIIKNNIAIDNTTGYGFYFDANTGGGSYLKHFKVIDNIARGNAGGQFRILFSHFTDNPVMRGNEGNVGYYQQQSGGAWVNPSGTPLNGTEVIVKNTNLAEVRKYCYAGGAWYYEALSAA